MTRRLPIIISVMCAATVFGATAQAGVANPPWPAQCPLKLGLLMDQSSSMHSRFGDVREAARNVVDALRDKRSEVSVIGFGTDAEVVSAAVDVSDQAARRALKDDIDDLDTHIIGGATNWEAALAAVLPLDLDVVVLVTDGEPSVSGIPAGSITLDPLAAAVVIADRLKTAGTRLVAVGIELGAGAEANLASVTGPQQGQDYFPSDTAGLLRQLYEIVASACGVPLAALPTPEPPTFPLLAAILAALAALLLLTFGGYLLHRRRGGALPRPAGPAPGDVTGDVTSRTTAGPKGRGSIADPTIDHRGIMPIPAPPAPPAPPPPPTRRSRSLDFLRDSGPDSDPRKDG